MCWWLCWSFCRRAAPGPCCFLLAPIIYSRPTLRLRSYSTVSDRLFDESNKPSVDALRTLRNALCPVQLCRNLQELAGHRQRIQAHASLASLSPLSLCQTCDLRKPRLRRQEHYYLILVETALQLIGKVSGCKWSEPGWTFQIVWLDMVLGMTSLEGLQDLAVRVLLLPRGGSGVSQSALKRSTLHINCTFFFGNSTFDWNESAWNWIYDMFRVLVRLVRLVRLSGSPEVWTNWLEHSLRLHTRGCSDQTPHPTEWPRRHEEKYGKYKCI